MAYLPIWRERWLSRGAMLGRVRHRVPADCPLCGCAARGGLLCDGCKHWVTLSMHASVSRCPVCCLALAQQGPCPDCALAQPAYDRVVAAFDYDEPGDLLIHYLKVKRQFALAAMLAGLLADAVRLSRQALPENTIVVSVPASQIAILRRGFNPAAELARNLARQLHLSYQPQLLRRTHQGLKQAHLSRAERARSTQALYACTRYVAGAHIAVVDDVMTTGSTLNSIARQFRAAGAASVCGLVLARTPHRLYK